jgi:hypothetical protein
MCPEPWDVAFGRRRHEAEAQRVAIRRLAEFGKRGGRTLAILEGEQSRASSGLFLSTSPALPAGLHPAGGGAIQPTDVSRSHAPQGRTRTRKFRT